MINQNDIEARDARLIRLKYYLDLDPQNLILSIDTLSLALELQRWELAESIFCQHKWHATESGEFSALGAYLYMCIGRYAEAEKLLKDAISMGVKNSNVFYNQAYCSLMQKDYDSALESIVTIENSTPPLDLAQAVLKSRILMHLSKYTDAISAIEEAHKTNQATGESAGLLSLLIYESNGPKESVLAWVNKALTLDSSNLEALISKTHLLIDEKNIFDAKLFVKSAVKSHPKSGRAWSLLGQIQFYEFDFGNAFVSLNEATILMPDHVGTWHLLGWTCLMSGDIDSAKMAFESAYDLDRTFGETHAALASIYIYKGQHALAEKHLKFADKLNANNLGKIYANFLKLVKENKLTEAKDYFEKYKNDFNPILGARSADLIEARILEISKKNGIPKNNTKH